MSSLFIAIAVIAVFATGLAKSNFAVSLGAVSVPLLTLVMPARDAAGMMLPILCTIDLVAILVYRREVDWRVYRIMVPGALVGTLVGWLLSAHVSESAVGLAVGVISLLFVLDAWLPLRKKLAGLPPSRRWGAFWGGVAGFTSFISHTGGPPYQIYAVPLNLKPVIFAGTTAMFFATVNYAKLVPFYFLGQLSVTNLELAAALIPVGLLGMVSGVWLVRRVDSRFFYRLAYVLIFVLSIDLIYEGMRDSGSGNEKGRGNGRGLRAPRGGKGVRGAGQPGGIDRCRRSARVVSGRMAPLLLHEFVLDLELAALEGGDQQVVLAQMRHLGFDLALEFLVTPFQRGDMAFSRHDNSFQLSERRHRPKNRTACRPLATDMQNRMQIRRASATPCARHRA